MFGKSDKMKIVYRPINELKPAEYNPRKISEKEFEDLRKSFNNLGTLEPAVINMNPDRLNVIISGHQRLKVAESLGMVDYPCFEVSFNLQKEREANIRMNKNTGNWDFDLLHENFEMDDLKDFGFDDLNFDVDGSGGDGEGNGEKGGLQQITFTLAPEQVTLINEKIAAIKKTPDFDLCERYGNEDENGNALFFLLQ